MREPAARGRILCTSIDHAWYALCAVLLTACGAPAVATAPPPTPAAVLPFVAGVGTWHKRRRRRPPPVCHVVDRQGRSSTALLSWRWWLTAVWASRGAAMGHQADRVLWRAHARQRRAQVCHPWRTPSQGGPAAPAARDGGRRPAVRPGLPRRPAASRHGAWPTGQWRRGCAAGRASHSR